MIGTCDDVEEYRIYIPSEKIGLLNYTDTAETSSSNRRQRWGGLACDKLSNSQTGRLSVKKAKRCGHKSYGGAVDTVPDQWDAKTTNWQ